MKLIKCPQTGLMLPSNHVDERVALKSVIDEFVDKTVNMHQHLDRPYFIVFHARFDKHNSGQFCIDAPKITFKIPPFVSNSMVFWVCNAFGKND